MKIISVKFGLGYSWLCAGIIPDGALEIPDGARPVLLSLSFLIYIFQKFKDCLRLCEPIYLYTS